MKTGNVFVRLLTGLWRGVDGVRKVLHLIVLLLFFAIVLGAISSTAPTLPGQAALVISPVGGLVEQLAGDPYDRAIAKLLDDTDPETLVRDVVDGLKFAQDDPQIEAVVLELDGFYGGGLSKLEEVAEAIQAFGPPASRSSHRPACTRKGPTIWRPKRTLSICTRKACGCRAASTCIATTIAKRSTS